ncbi:MAG: hypothetical protein ACFB2Z_13070 [Maricaulaceae bacterium]
MRPLTHTLISAGALALASPALAQDKPVDEKSSIELKNAVGRVESGKFTISGEEKGTDNIIKKLYDLKIGTPFKVGLDLNSGNETLDPSDLFSENLVAPERVVELAEDIGLDDAARDAIIDLIAERDADLTRLRLGRSSRGDDLDALLEATPIDTRAALEEFDELLTYERDLKRRQLETMIAVRNALSDDHIAALREAQKLKIEFVLNDVLKSHFDGEFSFSLKPDMPKVVSEVIFVDRDGKTITNRDIISDKDDDASED